MLRPKMNRFIAYNRVYQRKYISVAFVVKKKFEDKSEEGLAFQYFDENSTLDGYHQELMQTIHQCRRTDVKDPSSDMMDRLVRLPPVSYTHLDVYKRQGQWRPGYGNPATPGPRGGVLRGGGDP